MGGSAISDIIPNIWDFKKIKKIEIQQNAKKLCQTHHNVRKGGGVQEKPKMSIWYLNTPLVVAVIQIWLVPTFLLVFLFEQFVPHSYPSVHRVWIDILYLITMGRKIP